MSNDALICGTTIICAASLLDGVETNIKGLQGNVIDPELIKLRDGTTSISNRLWNKDLQKLRNAWIEIMLERLTLTKVSLSGLSNGDKLEQTNSSVLRKRIDIAERTLKEMQINGISELHKM